MSLSDSDEIRNLIASYSHHSDVLDAVAVSELFAPDGVFVNYGAPVSASRLVELVGHFADSSRHQPQPRGSRHVQTSTVIHELNGEVARTTTDLLLVDLDPEFGWQVGGTGQYLDDLVKIDGHWLFQRREVRWYKDLGRNPIQEHQNRDLFQSFAAGGETPGEGDR